MRAERSVRDGRRAGSVDSWDRSRYPSAMTERSEWARPAEATATLPPPHTTVDLDWVRRTLIQLDDEQRGLPPDDLVGRHAIMQTIDNLRTMLRHGYTDAIHQVREQWGDRAGRKGGHEVDHEAIAGMVRGAMPNR
jgi:hypothetical protein